MALCVCAVTARSEVRVLPGAINKLNFKGIQIAIDECPRDVPRLTDPGSDRERCYEHLDDYGNVVHDDW